MIRTAKQQSKGAPLLVLVRARMRRAPAASLPASAGQAGLRPTPKGIVSRGPAVGRPS
jgi:hypothetical protein